MRAGFCILGELVEENERALAGKYADILRFRAHGSYREVKRRWAELLQFLQR